MPVPAIAILAISIGVLIGLAFGILIFQKCHQCPPPAGGVVATQADLDNLTSLTEKLNRIDKKETSE